jgi:hypothetical protein
MSPLPTAVFAFQCAFSINGPICETVAAGSSPVWQILKFTGMLPTLSLGERGSVGGQRGGGFALRNLPVPINDRQSSEGWRKCERSFL